MTEATSTATYREVERQIATAKGSAALETALDALRRAMREIQKYRDDYNDATHPAQKAERLNWAINHLATSVLNNARLDMLANAQAALASLPNEEA